LQQQECLGSKPQFSLFAPGDGGGGSTMTAGSTIPDFDEDQVVRIPHYEVYLTATAAKVFGDEYQALLGEKVQGLIFKLLSFRVIEPQAR